MLEKFSAIRELKERLERLERKLEEQTNEQKARADEVVRALKELNNNVSELKGIKHGYVKEFSDDLKKVNELEKEFGKALRNFQQNHRQLYDSVYKQLHKDIGERTGPLSDVVSQLSKLGPESKQICESIKSTREEMDKLVGISRLIKKDDFELKIFAKELLKMDSEKLRLMKELETLKKIISFERRKRR